MKYDITFSCGHEGVVALFGKGKERESKIYWYENRGLCPECYQKQIEQQKKELEAEKEEERVAAAANAQLFGLPELTGSEKQIAWANVIRQKFIDNINKHELKDLGKKALIFILDDCVKASDWIDIKDESLPQTMERIIKMPAFALSQGVEFEMKLEKEITVEPQNKTFAGAPIITVSNNVISVKYGNNPKFKEIVKGLKFKWNPDTRKWQRKIYNVNGLINERAAELGNKLLNEGFAVNIPDSDIRNSAIDGAFTVENTRIISLCEEGSNKGKICIGWDRNDDDMFTRAKSIRNARYSRGFIYVEPSEFAQINDFAQIMGCLVADEAAQAMENYKSSVKIITPVAPIITEKEDKLKAILDSDNEIIDDLRDN